MPSGAIARLSSEGLSCRATVLRPVARSTRTSSPLRASTTHRLPLPSRLAAAGPDLEAVEAAHVLLDQPRRLPAGGVDLPQGVAEEHLRGIELAVAAVEVERVEA